MENEIKVSVCVVTYNQEKYIAECLQSLVDQETDYRFEIIVSDDCSTDGTRKIISHFCEKYPHLFKVFLHEKNMGALQNFRFAHDQGRGQYVAHMDGDDYALPGKLQAQSTFLDDNLDCDIVFHRMDTIEGEKYIETNPLPIELVNKKFGQMDIIELGAIGANSSRMYRAELRSFPLPDFDIVDYTVYVVHAERGYAAYCSNAALGVYRKGVGIAGGDGVYMSYYNSINYFLDNVSGSKKSVSVISLSIGLVLLKKRRFRLAFLFLKTFMLNICMGTIGRYFYVRKESKKLSGL